jgi:hypothetical protein
MEQQEFNIGVVKPVDCYKEGWEMIKDQYWLILGIVLVGMLISSVVGIIMGAMMCGIYIALLAKHDEGNTSFDLLFKGFSFFLPSFFLVLLIMIPVVVMVILVYVPLIGIAVAAPNLSQSELYAFIGATLAVEIVFAFIMVCIHTLLIFAFPLIVDRQLGAIGAIKLSARSVWNNMSGVVGLFLVGFVVSLVGMLIFCVGIYLTLPLIFAANVVAYRKVFPARESLRTGPPPPSAYANL